MAQLRPVGRRISQKTWSRRQPELVLLVTREGKPLTVPYCIFSYTFATMAFGQLGRTTGQAEYAEITKTFK